MYQPALLCSYQLPGDLFYDSCMCDLALRKPTKTNYFYIREETTHSAKSFPSLSLYDVNVSAATL